MGALSDKIKGKAKQIEGKLTGDRIRTGQGTVQKAKGDIEGAVNRVTDKVRGKVAGAKARAGRKAR